MEFAACSTDSSVPQKIRRLDPKVVNRIAAGEVIQRPANAIKEMMENSIDAKATSIQISVKEGGLKLIQIQDNGVGIQKEDLTLVCERFATSKLRVFEDLQTIDTFGFRGEALASISHIAHVTIKTKTAESQCAYQVNYCDGVQNGVPKPCAGNQGTLILVEDLYYNVPIRRRALQNYSTEYSKILDVVSRYAVHYPSIGFSCGDAVSAVKTCANSGVIDNIKHLFGVDKIRELLNVHLKDEKLQLKLEGFISSADHISKRTTFILFINHRLVESSALRKAIDVVYSSYLPKHQFPFIYLSLEMLSQNVDVNVHPTKQEVHFLNEGPIIEAIQKVVEERLLSCNTSRTMLVQSILPTVNDDISELDNSKKDAGSAKKIYDYNMIRTDSKEQKLDSFFQKSQVTVTNVAKNDQPSTSSANVLNINTARTPNLGPIENDCSLTGVPFRRAIALKSVVNLRQSVENSCDAGLLQCFVNYTFVGCVDRRYSLIQNQTKLYLLNINKLSEELFYQIMLRDFGNFSSTQLSEPAPVRELAELVIKSDKITWKDSYGHREEFPDYSADFLISKSAMLKDYFSLDIDKDGNLLSIPYLLTDYYPALEGLPMLIFQLCHLVDWESEQECFESLCKQLASFYRFPEFTPLDFGDQPTSEVNEESANSDKIWKHTVEFVLFSGFRKALKPSKQNLTNGLILQIANLPDLYKVFERC